MFNSLKVQVKDKILGLAELFNADPRQSKIDLGIGVYKDASGNTPVMRAITLAQKQLCQEETTKVYTRLAGEPNYHHLLNQLILADSVASERLSFAHTPGGTGAVRQILEMAKLTGLHPTIWVSNPTWPNHISISKHLGLDLSLYRYFDSENCVVDFTAMLATLSDVKVGDIVILHGCCHNPTGANLSQAQWRTLADFLLARGGIPMIDIAYQGFGDGLEADVFGVRLFASMFPEMLIAASCSKNFGIYRERAGLVITVSPNAKTAAIIQGNLAYLNRQMYSFPPDHGARLVTMVLGDEALRAVWRQELESMRLGMLEARVNLTNALCTASGSDRFSYIGAHRGMFTCLKASPDQVELLRRDYGIYMISDGRINIAGVTPRVISILTKALIAVGV